MEEYNLGENIRNRRIFLGKKQSEIAEQMGTSTSQVSKWENGITYPSVTDFENLSHILNINPEALADGRIQEDLIAGVARKRQRITTVILVILLVAVSVRFLGDIYTKYFWYDDENKYSSVILYKKLLEDGRWEIRQLAKKDNSDIWVDLIVYQQGNVIIDGCVNEVICDRELDIYNCETRIDELSKNLLVFIDYDKDYPKLEFLNISSCEVD
jgi:transcriptional regulator with XRE-family HTH domain